MIDWHCHILPGIDDGPETLAESLEMAKLLAAAGFRQVYCTPHCLLGRFDNRPSQVQKATEHLQKELHRKHIPLLLSPGMEYPLDEYFPVVLEQPQPLGDSRLLLVEVPRQVTMELVKENIQRILRRGLIPLLAHPERSEPLYKNPSLRKAWSLPTWIGRLTGRGNILSLPDTAAPLPSPQQELQAMGCLFQGNLPSFSERYGRKVRQQAFANLDQSLYSCFGSDGHDAESLRTFLGSALQIVSDRLQDRAVFERLMSV